MTYLHYMLGVTLFLSSSTYFAKAQKVNLPAIGNVTYWMPGSTVALNWTYNLEGNKLNSRSWTFKSKPQDETLLLVTRYQSNAPQYKTNRTVTYIEPATLLFQNASLADNGTYIFELGYYDGLSKQIKSEVEVIILVQPTANVSCPSNNKIKEGENFSCFCNGTTGNPPSLAKWSKNGVVTNGNKFKTKELAFENVTKHISGNYTCVVRSHNLTDSKVIQLLVQYSPKDVRIGTNISNKYIEVNTTVAITCRANAFPEANYTISRNGIALASANAMYIINSVKSSDSGRYDCVAENIIGKTSKSFQLNVKDSPKNVMFKANISRTYVDVNTTVAIICTADAFPKARYTISRNGTTLPSVNGGYIINSVKFNDSGRYDCVAENIIGKTSKSFQLNVKEKPSAEVTCNDLQGDDFSCSCKGIGGNPPPLAHWQKDGMILNGKGYKKNVLYAQNITNVGDHICNVTSHDLSDTEKVTLSKPTIKKISSGQPDDIVTVGSAVTITCEADGRPPPDYEMYHDGSKITKDIINGVYNITSVEKRHDGSYQCVAKNRFGNATASFDLTVRDRVLSADNDSIFLVRIVVIVIVIVIVVVILPIVFVYNRRRQQQLSAKRENLSNDLQRQPREESMPGIPLENVHSGPAGNIDGPEEDFFSWREIPRDDLNMGRFLGQGEFSKVVKAVWAEEEKNAYIPVAVKTVKDNATEVDKKELFEELKLMADVTQHPNVVNLLGACSKGGPLWVIVEFCEHGNLLSYIRNNRKTLSEDDRPFISSLDLVTRARFAYDVSKGMSHLEKMKVVHRDLAARNVLLGRNKIAKVSDFGLSRDIYETGLYQKSTGGKLPVRWMAIESLRELKYSSKSDVWSFGVMFWEIETAGLIPYAGIAGLDLSKHLQRGYRLPKPTETLPELYEIMKTCWESNPVERPSFEELHIKLEAFMEQNSDCLQVEDKDNADDDVANVLNYVEIVESE